MTVITELELGDVQTITPATPSDAESIFEEVCRLNPDARIEQTAEGEITIMAPTGGESGHQSSQVLVQLILWAATNATGVTFDSSTLFRLPNGARRMPDAAWIRKERIRALPMAVRKEFLPLTPDFCIEVMSPSDRKPKLHEKCLEYVANGAAETWLIDPKQRTVAIYTADEVAEFRNCDFVTSKSLPSFTIDLRPIWRGLDI